MSFILVKYISTFKTQEIAKYLIITNCSIFTYCFECNITLCIGIGRMHDLKSLLTVLHILSDIII